MTSSNPNDHIQIPYMSRKAPSGYCTGTQGQEDKWDYRAPTGLMVHPEIDL